VRRAAAALALAAAAACTSPRDAARVPPGDGPIVGLYRAAIEGGDAVRHAKVLLWAARPDRLHAEILSPVGGVRLILDAGGGRACVIDPAASVAYTGDGGEDAVLRIVGVAVPLDAMVEALLAGTPPSGLRVLREGTPAPALPERFAIEDGARALRLTLVRFQRSATDGDRLGTGEPPPALRVRPLDELPEPER